MEVRKGVYKPPGWTLPAMGPESFTVCKRRLNCIRFSNRTSCILDKMPMLHSHLSVPGPLASSPDPCPFVHTHQRIDRAGGSLSQDPCPCLASRSPPLLITCPRDRGYLLWGQGGKRGRHPACARQFSAVASFRKHRHIARGKLQPQSESSTAKVTGTRAPGLSGSRGRQAQPPTLGL